jgi:flagellar hook-basal body complex protein FliE
MLPISSIQPSLPITPAAQPGALAPAQPPGETFSTMLGKMVTEVNAKQINAADAVNHLQAGGNVSLHQAVIAMEEANVSFQLMVEVRNKLLDAYQEIMKMQV